MRGARAAFVMKGEHIRTYGCERFRAFGTAVLFSVGDGQPGFLAGTRRREFQFSVSIVSPTAYVVTDRFPGPDPERLGMKT